MFCDGFKQRHRSLRTWNEQSKQTSYLEQLSAIDRVSKPKVNIYTRIQQDAVVRNVGTDCKIVK